MTPQEKRAAELEREIERHRELYYNHKPEISDAEFDALEDELRELAPDSAVLSGIGATPSAETTGLPTKEHRIPMGSLEKVTPERLEQWVAKTGETFLVQEKLDGISLEIEYENGRMGDAITRGDGYVGEVVTHNAVSFKNVRRRLPHGFTGSVRGEVILRLSDFEEHFVGRAFANPRNTVSGTVRKKHGDRSLNRHFELYVYDVIEEGREFETEREKMEYLRDKLELDTAVSYFDEDLEGIRKIYERYQGSEGKPGKRFELDYEIDGLVLRSDSIELQRELGTVGGRPRWAMAYKFPSVGQITVLRDVDWSLGLGGRVTPVARLEPVHVGGVTVRNATLHNVDYIEALGVRLGDEVLVERKGDVIPQVVRVVKSHGGSKPKPPRGCPACATKLEVSGKRLICPNEDCPGRAYGDLMRWVNALEIDSLGEKWVRILCENGIVEDPADFYDLSVEELVPLERMGKTLAAKIVANIQASREPPLDRFIAALNVPEFSRQRAQMLIDAGYDTLETLQALGAEELAEVKGFGEILARKVVEGLAARKRRIRRVLDAGVKPAKVAGAKKDAGKLAGKTFCFTGAIHRENPATGKPYTRTQMQDLVVKHGGRAVSSVSSELDYLVLADKDSTSSKAQKARKFGTEILSEDEFFAMVE